MSQSDKKVAVPAKEKVLSSCEADEVEKYFVLFYYEHFVFYTSSVTFGDSFPSRGSLITLHLFIFPR